MDQGFWQRQARGFNQDVIQIAATGNQFAHDREELFLNRAAQATVGQLIHTTVGFFFGAANGALLEDVAIDAQFAEFVDDHRDAPTFGVVENVPQQRRFARPEETGNDSDGKFGQ